MKITKIFILLIFIFSHLYSQETNSQVTYNKNIKMGAEKSEIYFPLLKNKNIAIVANQTSILQTNKKEIHLVDYLYNSGIIIKKIFSPEHGFRGLADAGETVKNNKDSKTGIQIISLYGKNKKPTKEQLKGIEVILFDIQDVGVRFYTYISTLHYIMEAAAENNISVIVLDRPNPNGHYIDGPVLEKKYTSFIGMHTIPVVHGMTIGEYAKMINGEKWLANKINCNLTIIPLDNYTHKDHYSLVVFPSPNLKSDVAINLYPSLCFFEGTNVSEGRGTENPFTLFGSPYLENYNFSFTPKSTKGAKNPKYKDKICFGKNLINEPFLNKINLKWLIEAYKNDKSSSFFNSDSFFDKLAGTDKLREQIIEGISEEDIIKSWQNDLEKFKKIRIKYLIYR